MKGRSHHRLQSSDPPDDWVNGSWTVDCVCGVNFDDGEEMVNCDECGVWVHTRCSRYVKGDDNFVCDKCRIKNNRNDSEETEVAQLLVELPTKTMRIESSYVPNGPPRRPFRLWTDIPMEERVHVQGIPGGDPSLFSGLSSVFTPELWKCTGYVPKKFNFRYREFPCWDEKEGGDKVDEENENPVNRGAGVLFSLSKESVFATPVAALVGSRVGDEEAVRNRKVCLKETKKWESEGLHVRRSENGGKKESSLLHPPVLHSGKRKQEDCGMAKERSGKKRARAAEKEFDAKNRGTHSSKAVFTPTSDAKQLEFYEDRAPKVPKGEMQSTKNKNLKETILKEPTSDPHIAAHDTIEKHSTEALSSEGSRPDFSFGTGLKEEKLDYQHSAVLESSFKEDDAVRSSVQRDNIKEEGDSMAVGKLDDSFERSDKNVDKPVIKDLPGIVSEAKDDKVQDSNVDMSLRSERPNFEVKKELDDSSCSLPNIQSSPCHDAKESDILSFKIVGTSKPNGATISTSQSSDDKAENIDRTSEAVSNYPTGKADQLSGDPGQLKSELEGTDGLLALQKIPSELKHGSGLPEEHFRPGGTTLNSQGLHGQRKMVACPGKSSSTPANALTAKSSGSDNVRSADASDSNPVAKPQISSESNVHVKKCRSAHDVRDEDTDEMPRKTVKERPKLSSHSAPKPSHSSRMSHDPLSKKTTPESKDNVLFGSSKPSSAANTTAITSGSVEPTVTVHHQKATHTHNRTSASGLPQKGEKFSQPSFQPSSKINQSHMPSVCPPVSSSSPATLSDEELALLLHQELNSSPRVPRVPRVRNAGSLPQLASPSTTSMLIKRTSSSVGKDHSTVSRRKYRDAPRDGFRGSREVADEAKRKDRVSCSQDLKRQDTDHTAEASTKRDDNGSSAMESVKKNMPSTSAATNSGPSSSADANERNTSSIRSSPRSDEDTGTVGGPVRRTLPGLINEIMSKGRRMTYEELCNAVLPHWHNLRKHNGERYAYTSHSQAVLDCLRNRHEWARLVDRGPKTSSSRKRRKLDADDSEDNGFSKGKTTNQVESKSLESQKEDFPKGKRKARKRRRLALQGRGVKDMRNRRKQEVLTDEDFGTSSNSSEESLSSEDEIQGGGARQEGSEASVGSDDAGIM